MLRLLGTLGRRRARGRALLSVLGIALGVALGYGIYLVNRAAVEDLAASVRAVAGEADLQVRGGRSGFPEALYPRIARLPGVAWVNPGLELDAGIAGTERTIRVIGVDVLRQGKPELLAPDKVLLSPLFFFSSRRRHTRSTRDWSSDVCSSDLSGSNSRISATQGSIPFRSRTGPLRFRSASRSPAVPSR